MIEASDIWRRPGGDPAFGLVLTVRAAPDEPVDRVLDFLEPGWGVLPLPSALPGHRRVVVQVEDEESLRRLGRAVGGGRHPRVTACVDRLWSMSAGGRVQVRPRLPVRTAEDLALVYTPGVARLAARIATDAGAADAVTGRGNRVAVLSDGTAVLGLGDVGPLAALPVMEGKAALFAQLADVDAVPLCVNVPGADELVALVRALAPTFGGIHLGDIAAPRCFEVEERLQAEVDIPVFHDDHGTAIVVLAGLRNALRVVGKKLETARVVVVGAGAAGTAVTKLLCEAGAGDVVVCTAQGVLSADVTEGLRAHEAWLAEHTNPRRVTGGLAEALDGADAVIGLSRPGVLTRELVTTMALDPIVFALANPEPEIRPEQLSGLDAVVATGRSCYANQITSALAFPGVFRGVLNARAPRITAAMRLAAADALAGLVGEDHLSARRLLPDVLDPQVVPAVSAAVATVEVSRRSAHASNGDALVKRRRDWVTW